MAYVTYDHRAFGQESSCAGPHTSRPSLRRRRLRAVVQLQKSLFVLGRRRAKDLGGDFYNFQPYDYGPFDASVYHDADALPLAGLDPDRRTEGMPRSNTVQLVVR